MVRENEGRKEVAPPPPSPIPLHFSSRLLTLNSCTLWRAAASASPTPGALGDFFRESSGSKAKKRRTLGAPLGKPRVHASWWFSLGKQTSSSSTPAPPGDRHEGRTHLLWQQAAAAAAASPSVWKSCASTGGPVRVSEQLRARARRHAVVVCRYRCRLADGFVGGAGRTREGGWRGACRTATSTTTTAATTAKRLAPWEGTHRAASAGWSVTDGVGCACCVKASPTSDLARLPLLSPSACLPHTNPRLAGPPGRRRRQRRSTRLANRSARLLPPTPPVGCVFSYLFIYFCFR